MSVFLVCAILLVGTQASNLTKDLNFRLNNGNLISQVGFGTLLIKGTQEVRNALDLALAAGYRLIDTAKLYDNEEEIGKALKELLPKYNLTRKDIWITTKLSYNDQGTKAYEALKESIRKLDTEYVDLYLIHWPGGKPDNSSNENNPHLRDESWKQMAKGVKEGLTRNIGVSNYLVKHLEPLVANDHGVKPVVNQLEWHPHYHPQDLLEYARKEGILLQGYYSLGGTRFNGTFVKDPVVGEIAKKLGKTPAQVLLKWSLQQGVAVIPRSTSKKHVDENIDLDFTLPEEDFKTLSDFDAKKYSWDPEIII